MDEPDQPTPSLNLKKFPVLLLNADYQPLSYYPLSLRSAEWGIKLVYEGAVDLVAEYEAVARSQRHSMRLPSVVALKRMRPPMARVPCTRFNLFLRDDFVCQYCGGRFHERDLEEEHVQPRSRGGKSTWKNLVAACRKCNSLKDDMTPREAGMPLLRTGYRMEQPVPSSFELYEMGKRYPPAHMHPSWHDYVFYEKQVEAA